MHFITSGLRFIEENPPYRRASAGTLDLYETPTGNYFLPSDAIHDHEINAISWGEVFDGAVVATARRYMRPGTAVLDLGANFGQMSVLFSQAVGPSGSVSVRGAA